MITGYNWDSFYFIYGHRIFPRISAIIYINEYHCSPLGTPTLKNLPISSQNIYKTRMPVSRFFLKIYFGAKSRKIIPRHYRHLIPVVGLYISFFLLFGQIAWRINFNIVASCIALKRKKLASLLFDIIYIWYFYSRKWQVGNTPALVSRNLSPFYTWFITNSTYKYFLISGHLPLLPPSFERLYYNNICSHCKASLYLV